VQTRVVTELEKLSAQHTNARVAIVSHADVIKAAVGYFAATPIDLLQRIEISPCSVSIVKDGTRLLTINNTGALPDLL
jgi:probable phosphoglycerate mutase